MQATARVVREAAIQDPTTAFESRKSLAWGEMAGGVQACPYVPASTTVPLRSHGTGSGSTWGSIRSDPDAR